MSESKPILIVGLGMVGLIHGYALAQAGFEVIHKVRPGKTAREEITIDLLDLRTPEPQNLLDIYRPKLVKRLEDKLEFQLVMFPVSASQMAGAVRETASVIDPLKSQYLLFGSNWEGRAAIDEIIPHESYLWGYSAASGGWGEDGVFYANLRPDYRIGDPQSRGITPRLEEVIKIFAAAGLKPDFQPDILGWLWMHFALNAALVGSALYAGGLDKITEQAELSYYAGREGLAVLEKRGLKPEDYPDARPFLEMSPREYAEKFLKPYAEQPISLRVQKAGHFKSNPEEMKSFAREVQKTARELGLPTPHLDLMVEKPGG